MTRHRFAIPAFLISVLLASPRAGPAQTFRVAKFNIGGEGGTDRVFVSRGTHVMVVDGSTGKVLGDCDASQPRASTPSPFAIVATTFPEVGSTTTDVLLHAERIRFEVSLHSRRARQQRHRRASGVLGPLQSDRHRRHDAGR